MMQLAGTDQNPTIHGASEFIVVCVINFAPRFREILGFCEI